LKENGLTEERLLLITSEGSQIESIDLEAKEVKLMADSIGQGDGIAALGDGGYITTSWKGAVFHISSEGKVMKLLDTEELGENAADACFDTASQILYLPTFFKNQVKAYRLVK
jgi:hypothetical protein